MIAKIILELSKEFDWDTPIGMIKLGLQDYLKQHPERLKIVSYEINNGEKVKIK